MTSIDVPVTDPVAAASSLWVPLQVPLSLPALSCFSVQALDHLTAPPPMSPLMVQAPETSAASAAAGAHATMAAMMKLFTGVISPDWNVAYSLTTVALQSRRRALPRLTAGRRRLQAAANSNERLRERHVRHH